MWRRALARLGWPRRKPTADVDRAPLGLLFGPFPARMRAEYWGDVVHHPRYVEAFTTHARQVFDRRGWQPTIGMTAPPNAAVSMFEMTSLCELLHQASQLAVVHAERLAFDWVGAISIGEFVAGAAAGAYSPDDSVAIGLAALEAALSTQGQGDLVLIPHDASAALQAVGKEFPYAWRGVRSSVLAVTHEQMAALHTAVPNARALGLGLIVHTPAVDMTPLRPVLARRAAREPIVPLYLASVGGRLEGRFDEPRIRSILEHEARMGDCLAAVGRERTGELLHIGSIVLRGELEAAKISRTLKSINLATLIARGGQREAPIPIHEESFRREPNPTYERCRHRAVHGASDGAMLVTGHAEVLDVLRSSEVYTMPPDDAFPVLHGLDGPEHQRRRRLLSEHMSPARQRERAEAMAVHTTVRVAALRDRQSFNLVEDLAGYVPRLVTCEWLGVTEQGMSALLSGPPAHIQWTAVAPYVLAEGVLPKLHAAGELTPDEVAQLGRFLLFAGLTTITDFAVNAVCSLYERPALLDAFRQGTLSLEDAVDELLRLDAPAQMVDRVAKSDQVIDGVHVPAGTRVRLSIGAANRDPKVFAEPNVLASEARKVRSLTFGHGPHYCLGAPAGRAYATILLHAIVRDLAAFEPSEPIEGLLARSCPNLLTRRRVEEITFVRRRDA